MSLTFEWDDTKAEQNKQKHRVSFEEAATIFGDPLSLTIDDPLHSQQEERCRHDRGVRSARLLVVVHTDRDERVRIISAREATGRER